MLARLGWPGKVRAGLFGLLAAAIGCPLIFWSNAFPSGQPESDSEYASSYAVGYGFILLYIVAAGAYGSWRSRRPAAGAWAGAVTALIAVSLVMATFAIVDNVYLDVVSRQPDKIAAFHASGYRTIRESINAGLVSGAVHGIPFATAIGAVAGILGALLGRFLRGGWRNWPRPLPTAS